MYCISFSHLLPFVDKLELSWNGGGNDDNDDDDVDIQICQERRHPVLWADHRQ